MHLEFKGTWSVSLSNCGALKVEVWHGILDYLTRIIGETKPFYNNRLYQHWCDNGTWTTVNSTRKWNMSKAGASPILTLMPLLFILGTTKTVMTFMGIWIYLLFFYPILCRRSYLCVISLYRRRKYNWSCFTITLLTTKMCVGVEIVRFCEITSTSDDSMNNANVITMRHREMPSIKCFELKTFLATYFAHGADAMLRQTKGLMHTFVKKWKLSFQDQLVQSFLTLSSFINLLAHNV
mmetsp:Transcript_41731/g.67769  ORF Transcript_41731/g.67769 Transcript_41731/m.67769 type:complete len:237 (-) Transcript_41731:1359-2069(-)